MYSSSARMWPALALLKPEEVGAAARAIVQGRQHLLRTGEVPRSARSYFEENAATAPAKRARTTVAIAWPLGSKQT